MFGKWNYTLMMCVADRMFPEFDASFFLYPSLFIKGRCATSNLRTGLYFVTNCFTTKRLNSCSSPPRLPQTIAEFDLGTINYEVKSPKCHELSLALPPHDRISFNFRSEQDAKGWATVLMSALGEVHRGQWPFLLPIFPVLCDQICCRNTVKIDIHN